MAVDVGIVLGSASDWPEVEPAALLLKEWSIPFEVVVASAHRAPKQVQAYAREAAGRGVKVIIAAAGMAAHLAGVLAAETILPVIGVPMPGSPLRGWTACSPRCRCRPGCRWPPWPSARPGPERRHLRRPNPGPERSPVAGSPGAAQAKPGTRRGPAGGKDPPEFRVKVPL